MAFDAAPLHCPSAPFAPDAKAAVEAVIVAGAKLLIEEPWRVSRIIRGADAMTFPELAAETKRRRALSSPADFNRALALGQLARALEAPAFVVAWRKRARACARSPAAAS
ncbi:MAG TPA: hypothetical protein VKS78_03355 [Roseiarcus sp.]|nr:hypothetical protein [Roseiarcus sp.]